MAEEQDQAYKHKLELFKAVAELKSKEKDTKLSHGYIKAYFWSIFIPPIGIYYFVKYVFFSDGGSENIKAGIISLILTLVSFFLSIWLLNEFFKHMSSIIPSGDTQMLKDLTVPENQKTLFKLLK